ncbi:sensor histidine kinase [Pseudidiomarina insulisalsae]|uniref:histidine kinase n=1 Tax=Pseudidiomarina insulisalsae TaxID=575789 RepID=A0A432YA84_9GAMM|nr:DUF4118 domain-containing protein [Pseudidiomarina insulisalsae]RUO57890.1 sensor histidine kinase [Pseudidiomarina insulisalsae]
MYRQILQRKKYSLIQLLRVVGIMLTTAAIAFLLEQWLLPSSGTALILLLGVIVTTVMTSFRGAVIAAIVGALLFNILFTTPRGTLHMIEVEEIATLVVFFLTAMASSYWVVRNRTAQTELRAAELKSQLLFSLSHDLRTPLASILGNLTTLLDYRQRISTHEQNELLTNAVGETNRLQHYLENLLQATKFEYKSVQLTYETIHLSELLQSVVDRLETSAPELSLELSEEALHFHGQRALLEQALFNLLENALRYRKPGTAVRVEVSVATSPETVVKIAISNQVDPGFDPQQLTFWGEPFISRRNKDHGAGGMGLGISVAYGIIRAHKGQINAILETAEKRVIVSIELPINSTLHQGDNHWS